MSSQKDKKAQLGPGVDLLDSKQLLHYAQDTSEAGRYRLANAVSEFFEERELNDTEQRLAGEIMLDLIRQAEKDLRQALAERLSVQDNVPSDLIVFLANDDISVARPVLQNSPMLNDVDLVYIIASKSEEYWQSIALRKHLSPIVTDRLIETGDEMTALNLVSNDCITLHKHSMKKLVKTALKSEELQGPLLRRPEISGDLAVDLYICVSHALRQELAGRFQIPAALVEQSLDRLVEELSMEARGSRHVTPEMMSLAKRFSERGEIFPDTMVKTLRRGQVAFFIALFAEKVGFAPENVLRLIQKDGGKPFAVACRSIGMMKSEFASIFLLSRGIHSGDKIIDQRELAMALKYYDTLKDMNVHATMRRWAKNPSEI